MKNRGWFIELLGSPCGNRLLGRGRAIGDVENFKSCCAPPIDQGEDGFSSVIPMNEIQEIITPSGKMRFSAPNLIDQIMSLGPVNPRQPEDCCPWKVSLVDSVPKDCFRFEQNGIKRCACCGIRCLINPFTRGLRVD